MCISMEKHKVRKIFKRLGGQTKVAKDIGTNQSTIGSWIIRGRIPAHRAKELYDLYGESARLSDLCPDLWGD